MLLGEIYRLLGQAIVFDLHLHLKQEEFGTFLSILRGHLWCHHRLVLAHLPGDCREGVVTVDDQKDK